MQQPETRQKARTRWGAVIVCGGLALALAVVYGLQTPEYALFRLERAVTKRDLAAFYASVDLPSIIDSIADAENTRRITREAKTEWRALAHTMENNLGKVLKPKQLNLVQREIEARFRNVQLPDAADEVLGQLLATRNFFREVEGGRLGSVARQGAVALVNWEVRIPKLNKSYTLLLRMGQADGWRIHGVEGLASTLDEYARDQQQYLQQYNANVVVRLAKAMSCQGVIEKSSRLLGLQKSLSWDLRCLNQQAETIAGVSGRVLLRAKEGPVLKELPLQKDELGWVSGQEWRTTGEEGVGLFDGAGKEAFAEAELRVEFAPDELRFASGRVLRLVQRYEETGGVP